MNELDTIQIFLKVAELQSFSGAARQLGLPNATVSSAVRQLELGIETRLLQRTTRQVRLTPEGALFYARSRDLLGEFDELRAMFRAGPHDLAGRLRVDMSVAMATRILLPRLGEFMERHPRLQLDLGTADRRVDVVREGYDCVLRAGPLADSSLVARPLGSMRMVNVASPAYLARHGVPARLDDLAAHRIVHYDLLLGANPPCWEWFDGARTHTASVGTALSVNGTAAYEAACLAGLGIAQTTEAGVRDCLAAGTLVTVMPAFEPAPMPLYAVYPSRRHVPARVSAFIDWVEEVLVGYVV